MEERADVMTDNQWDGLLKMVLLVLKKSKTVEQAMKGILFLVRDKESAADFLKEYDDDK